MPSSSLAAHVVAVPDFPRPGILFRDIMPLLRDRFDATLAALDATVDDATWSTVDVIGGIESRGFVLAAGLAARRGKGFVPVRKAGKLPPPVVDEPYGLEYGTGVLEMHPGSGGMLIVDDVLATGGTLRAAAELAARAGYDVRGLRVLVDIGLVSDFAWREQAVASVIQYG